MSFTIVHLTALLLVGLEGPAAPSCPFVLEDRIDRSGIEFVHDSGARGAKHLPETMGAGAAWLDYDGDGRLDLYLVQSGPFPPDGSAAAGNRLYRNLGGDPVRFEDVTVRSGAGDRGYGQGALAVDLDGDAALDLWVGNYGGDTLLWNQGDGTYRSESLGVAGERAPSWSSSAAAADADLDGDLDLYVVRYLEYDPDHELFCGELGEGGSERRDYCDPSLFLGQQDRLLINRGDRTLEDATVASGLESAVGKGLGVVFTDLDGDARPDLYVANDLTLNLTFRNETTQGGSAQFQDVSLLAGSGVNRDGKPEAGMGVAAADFDRDGDPELLVTNFDVETNTYYENLGELVFDDASLRTGFALPSFNRLGFGLVAADFDGDGWLDAYVANGHIFEQPKRDNVSYRQPDLLLGGGAEGLVSRPCALERLRAAVGRAAASADFDLDGDVDLVVTNSADRPFLLVNSLVDATDDGGAASWLGVELLGRAPNHQAIGARVDLVEAGDSSSETTVQRRWIQAGDSYQSSSERGLRFGLSRDGGERRLEVEWPSGRRLRIVSPPSGRIYRLVEGEPVS